MKAYKNKSISRLKFVIKKSGKIKKIKLKILL